MTTTFIHEHSRKLIRCKVKSSANSTSLRYIEMEHYNLWSYMMHHKHGMQIFDASLWLWIPEQLFTTNQDSYAHFQEIDEVNKIELCLFDDLHGFTHLIYRYVITPETDMLQQILLSHISPDLANGGNYEMKTNAGYCIRCGNNIKKMILGLSGPDEQIWY